MLANTSDFRIKANAAVFYLSHFAHKHSLQGRARADHFCYKCGSAESFEHMRKMLEGESDFIFQSIISRRRIAYIRLKNPIETVLGSVEYLELSDQKPDKSQMEGFDHVEAYPVGWSYEDMITMFEDGEETVMLEERPHHTTHSIIIARPENPFLFRCTREPLIEKIKREEMK